MKYLEIEKEIETTQQQLIEIKENFARGSLSQEQAKEAIKGFSLTLEELNVAIEELNAQNTDLITTRQALEIEHQKYLNLFNLAPESYIITDTKGVILEVNKATELLLKVKQHRLVNKPLVLYIAPGDRANFHTQLDLVVDSGQTLKNYEIKMQTRKNEEFAALLSVSKQLDDQEQTRKLLWSFRDISDRRKAEEHIRQQAALLEVTMDAIIVADTENKIIYWNSRAEELYGWKKEEALGKDITTLWWEEDTIPEIAIGKRIVTERGNWHQELKKLTQEGQELLVESRWFQISDRQNLPKGILIIDTDITEKKHLEHQLLRAQRLESLGTLAGGIAHDLNNILNPILGAAQLIPLVCPDQNDQSSQLLNLLQTNARRGANIVQQILSYSNNTSEERQNVELGNLIQEVKQLISVSFSKQIEIYTSFARDLWQISAYPSQIHQILMNVCINARDAMGEKGTLLLCAENCYIDENYASRNLDARVGNYVMITVSDTGCGMSSDIIDRIYEPFFTTKIREKGTGLGLFTVINIVQNHDGFIKVSSRVGKGTHFQIFFPAIDSTQVLPVEQFKEKMPQGRGELILIVDDEEDNRKMIQMLLEESGYCTLTACNGEEAILIQQQHRDEIDLILMDLIMPTMDGTTAISRIVENDPQAKIIITSGLIEPNAIANLPHLKGYLTKPLTIEKVLESINNALA